MLILVGSLWFKVDDGILSVGPWYLLCWIVGMLFEMIDWILDGNGSQQSRYLFGDKGNCLTAVRVEGFLDVHKEAVVLTHSQIVEQCLCGNCFAFCGSL